MYTLTKREIFYQQIREKQRHQVFKKFRKQFQAINTPSEQLSEQSSLSWIMSRIVQLKKANLTISTLYDQEEEIILLIRKINFSIDDISDTNQFKQILNFLYSIVKIISDVHDIDEEPNLISSENKTTIIPLAKLLTKIKFLLINFLAANDEVVTKNLDGLRKFTSHFFFIQCYHNIFLNTAVDPEVKCQFFENFLKHLQEKPEQYFAICHTMTQYIYYALCQPPSLLTQKKFHYRILDRLNSGFSYLQFYRNSKKISQMIQSSFNIDALRIIGKLICRNQWNAMKLIKSPQFMKQCEKKLIETVSELSEQQNIFTVQKCFIQTQLQGMKLQYLVNFMQVFQNLSFFDEIVSQIYHNNPIVWTHLLRLYYIIGNRQNNQRIQKSQHYNTFKKQIIAEKALKTMGNMLTNVTVIRDLLHIDQNLQTKLNQNHRMQLDQIEGDRSFKHKDTPKAISCLLNIYYKYYKSEQKIKLECLYIFNNITSGFVYLIEQYLRRNQIKNCIWTVRLFDSIMDVSSSLVYHILKISHKNSDVLQALLKNFSSLEMSLLDSQQNILRLQFFRDSTFISMLRELSDYEKSRQYNNQIIKYAQSLMDILEEGEQFS